MDESTHAALGPSRAVRIIPVHGTWALGLPFKRPARPGDPRWFEQGSSFLWQIQALLVGLGQDPVVEPPHRWNHWNSLFDRGDGARELAARLRAMPPEPCLIVAHSHGGNVVLRALDDLSDEHVARLSVVTMSTPFVEMYLPSPDTPNHERLWFGVLVSLVGFGIGTACIQAMIAGGLQYWPALLAAFVLLWLGIYVLLGVVPAEQRCLQQKQPCLALNLARAAAYDKLKDRPPHLLVLRGVEDEAALAIGTAAALGRGSQFVRDALLAAWHRKGRSVVVAGGVFLLSLLAFYVAARLGGTEAPPDARLVSAVQWAGIISSSVIVGLQIVAMAAAVFFRALAGAAAGRELLLLPHIEVTVATSPDFNADKAAALGRIVQVVTVPRRGVRTEHIRHQLYDDDQLVPRAIGPWLGRVYPLRRSC